MNPRARRELSAYLGLFPRSGLAPPLITSTDRTVAHNRAVGGLDNSKHLYGLAADIVPPAGAWRFRVTFSQLAANVRAWLPHVEAIAEKDHVHIEWPWNY